MKTIKEHVSSYARSKFEIVEFLPKMRLDRIDFLQVVQTVSMLVLATSIFLIQSVSRHQQYGAIFKYLIDHVKTDREDYLFPYADDLGMAVANSLAAVKMVPVVEGTINGIGERQEMALEEVAVALNIREDY